jgi:hypothetical protein
MGPILLLLTHHLTTKILIYASPPHKILRLYLRDWLSDPWLLWTLCGAQVVMEGFWIRYWASYEERWLFLEQHRQKKNKQIFLSVKVVWVLGWIILGISGLCFIWHHRNKQSAWRLLCTTLSLELIQLMILQIFVMLFIHFLAKFLNHTLTTLSFNNTELITICWNFRSSLY